jgi:proline iminopeptidase
MEAIRIALGIDRWIIVGGSWGATLALAYTQHYPDRVLALVLRAVFLGSREELHWAFIEAPRRFRPELFADFLDFLPAKERSDPLEAYWRRITDPDPRIHVPAALAWHGFERALSALRPFASRLTPADRSSLPDPLPRSPFLEAHYFLNDCFLEPHQLLRDASRLRRIPGVIVQGRYDLLCPPSTSAALASVWPEAKLCYVEGAGHAMSEPGIADAMSAALQELGAVCGDRVLAG